MNSFVLNFRRAFARVRATLVAVMDPAATENTLRWATHSDSDEKNVRRELNSAVPWLNWIDWSERVLMAFFAFTIGGFAVAGTYPASYGGIARDWFVPGPINFPSEIDMCNAYIAVAFAPNFLAHCENPNSNTVDIYYDFYGDTRYWGAKRVSRFFSYARGNPIKQKDPFGLDVYLCQQPAFGISWNPVDHYWVKTDTVEAGMGGTRGLEPGNQAGDQWGDPVQVTDHSGRSKQPLASCRKIEDADENKVNDLLKIGRPLGKWGPTNQCQTFARGVISQTTPAPAPFNNSSFWGF